MSCPPPPPNPPSPSPPKPALIIQTTFRLTGTETAADFEVICLLGQGGFGVVKKVQHKGSGMLMAVKELNDPTSSVSRHAARCRQRHTACQASPRLDEDGELNYMGEW